MYYATAKLRLLGVFNFPVFPVYCSMWLKPYDCVGPIELAGAVDQRPASAVQCPVGFLVTACWQL